MMVMMMMTVKIVVMVVKMTVMLMMMVMSVTHGGFSSPPPFLVCPLDTPHLSLLYIPWKYHNHTICCKANKELRKMFFSYGFTAQDPDPTSFSKPIQFPVQLE